MNFFCMNFFCMNFFRMNFFCIIPLSCLFYSISNYPIHPVRPSDGSPGLCRTPRITVKKEKSFHGNDFPFIVPPMSRQYSILSLFFQAEEQAFPENQRIPSIRRGNIARKKPRGFSALPHYSTAHPQTSGAHTSLQRPDHPWVYLERNCLVRSI